MSGIRLLAAFGATLLSGSPAIAQDSAPAHGESSNITVEGRKSTKKEIRAFVNAIGENPAIKQLTRFEDAICPAVIGLSPRQASAVDTRLRQVAKAVGIKAAPAANCYPNVHVILTANKSAFVKALVQVRPDYFGEFSPMEVRRLAATRGPAVAWHREGPLLTKRGTPVFLDEGMGSDPTNIGGHYVNRTMEPDTRASNSVRPQFQGAVVVIEANAVEGLTTTQLADYVAMRAFARTYPDRLDAAPTASILKVLETPMGSPAAPSMTQWDLGYLRGLYSSDPYLFAGAQRGAIGREIAKQTGLEAR